MNNTTLFTISGFIFNETLHAFHAAKHVQSIIINYVWDFRGEGKGEILLP